MKLQPVTYITSHLTNSQDNDAVSQPILFCQLSILYAISFPYSGFSSFSNVY